MQAHGHGYIVGINVGEALHRLDCRIVDIREYHMSHAGVYRPLYRFTSAVSVCFEFGQIEMGVSVNKPHYQ